MWAPEVKADPEVVFPLMVLPVIVTVPSNTLIPPAVLSLLLPVMVLLVMVTSPRTEMPPPAPLLQVLPVMRLSETSAVALP